MSRPLRLVYRRPPLGSAAVELTDQAGAFEVAYGEYLGARFALISATPRTKTARRAECHAARERFALEVAAYLALAGRYDELI